MIIKKPKGQNLRKVDKTAYNIRLQIMNGNPIKEKSLLSCLVMRRISIPFLISIITLVSSSLYLSPLAYSQELSFAPILREYGAPEVKLSGPEGIAVDQQGNVYVADTANSRIQVFSSNGTFISKWGRYGVGNGTFGSPTGIAIDHHLVMSM